MRSLHSAPEIRSSLYSAQMRAPPNLEYLRAWRISGTIASFAYSNVCTNFQLQFIGLNAAKIDLSKVVYKNIQRPSSSPRTHILKYKDAIDLTFSIRRSVLESLFFKIKCSKTTLYVVLSQKTNIYYLQNHTSTKVTSTPVGLLVGMPVVSTYRR